MIVVFDENDAPLELRHPRVFIDLLNEALARFVLRMRLACEDKLHRAFDVVQKPCEPFAVCEKERRALVGRKPSREANREHFRIEHMRESADFFRAFTEALTLCAHAVADKRNRAVLLPLMGIPNHFIRDVLHFAPEVAIRQLLLPSGEIFVVERDEIRRGPRFGVNAVRHARDGHFRHGHSGPHILPQTLRNTTVQRAYTICVAARAQGENRHRKWLMRIFPRLAETRESLEINTHLLRVIAEVFLHQLEREGVISRRHRRVRGEDVARRRRLQRGVKIQLSVLHAAAD